MTRRTAHGSPRCGTVRRPDSVEETVAPAAEIHGRLLARNTLYNLLGLGLPMVVAAVAVRVLVDGLGLDRFGILAIAWIFLSYLGELGFGTATAKFAAEAIGAGRDAALVPIAWTTAAIQVVIGLAEGVALALATPFLVARVLNIPPELIGEARTCLFLLAAALPVIGVGKAFRGLLDAAQRFDLVTAVRLPTTIGNYALPMLGLALGWELPALFALLLAGRIAAGVAFFLLAARLYPTLSRPRFARDEWRRIFGFGGWVTVSTVVSPMLGYLDRLLLGALVTMTAVAHYAAPYEVVVRLVVIPASLVATLFPAFSQLSGGAERDRIPTLAARSVKVVLVVLAPAVIVLLGGAADVLRLWLGVDFARESALAMQILAVGILFNAAAHVPYALLQGTGRPDMPAKFHMLELPVHALVAWALITLWGIPGAALAWSVRVALDAVLLFAGSARTAGLTPRTLAAERVPHLLAFVTTAGALAALWTPRVDAFEGRAAIVCGLVGATMVVGWRFAMGEDERARVRRLLRPAPRGVS